jgi:predicted RNA-binding protein with RPS1 domain
MTTAELTTTVRNLKDLMTMKEELEAEITAAQDAIKAEMCEKACKNRPKREKKASKRVPP